MIKSPVMMCKNPVGLRAKIKEEVVELGNELAMFVAADAKNLLKAFAISVLSVVGVPLVQISVTL